MSEVNGEFLTLRTQPGKEFFMGVFRMTPASGRSRTVLYCEGCK